MQDIQSDPVISAESNMRKKSVAIVLAGSVPHIALIENLKNRGYYTILVDYYENPPAKEAADEHVRQSTLDRETVLKIAQKVNADLVITTCMDHANVTACYVAEKLGLPAPYSHETALMVTNKELMKEKMIRNGVPTSKYIIVKDVSSFDSSGLRFPVVVKPADSNGSKGVRKACDYIELNQFLPEALIISRSGKAVIEEFKQGREIGVDCFVKDKEAFILMTKERRKIEVEKDPIQQIKGCIWPAKLAETSLSKMKQIADQIAHVFDLENTPLMIQAIVNGNDISIIEFAARFGGGESFRVINLSTGFDIVDAAIDSFLGLPVTLDHKFPDAYYADNFIYTKSGFFGSITGHEELLKKKIIEYLDTYKSRGTEIGSELSSNNRIGVFTVKSKNMNGLFEKINKAVNHIEVYDIHGEPIMRRDIYSS